MAWSSAGGHSLPPSTRQRIRRKYAGRCQWPTTRGRCLSQDRCQVDHRRPVAEGGTDDDHNLWLLCHHHHAGKTAGEAARGRDRATPARQRAPERHPGRRPR